MDRSKKLQARFHVTWAGRRPVRDWFLALSEGDRRIIGKDIQKVEFGWPIGMPHCRPLGGGLWEVRSNLTDGRLLHGFEKKSRKTPEPDISLARNRLKEIE